MSILFRGGIDDLLARINAPQGRGAIKAPGKSSFAAVLGAAQNLSSEPPTAEKRVPVVQTDSWTNADSLNPPWPPATASIALSAKPTEIFPREANLCSVITPTNDVKSPSIPAPPSVPKVVSAQRHLAAVTAGHKNSRAEIESIITDAGRRHGLDPLLSLAVAEAESSLRPDVVSSDGHASKGIFQLLDSTAQGMIEHLNVSKKYEPFDPKLNSHLGVGYLRRLHDIFSAPTNITSSLQTIPARSAADLEKLAVAAFNTGEGNVAEAQKTARRLGKDPGRYLSVEPHLSQITQAYVKKVTARRDSLAATNTQPDELG